MRTFGLIGFPLTHSFSPRYFKEKFEKEGIEGAEYLPFQLDEIEDFEKLVEKRNPVGINVTIPYKKQVIDHLDELSPEAKRIGAVNTITFIDGHRKGHNTDIYGFHYSLLELLDGAQITDALVLGTGGAAQAVQYVLEEMNICYHNVSRRAEFLNYEDLNEEIIKKHKLIINTTPLGTYPKQDGYPNIPYEYLSDQHYLYDLVYNPPVTRFMQKGMDQGAKAMNGLKMLHLQAERAWEIWNEEI